MLTISQFAAACNTTVKTLRHYDQIGLLKADYVSEESGYRYYRKGSLAKYKQIVSLKQAGFTLKEIKEKFMSRNFKEAMETVEHQMLLLEKKHQICECIKKEYEKAMKESKRVIVTRENEQILITEKETKKSTHVFATAEISDRCAELMEHAMNADAFIHIDFGDFTELLNGRTAVSCGTCYSPDCSITVFDNINISKKDEQSSALILFFEASPDTSEESIAEAVSSLMLSFSDKADVLFSADRDNTEKGITLHWICLQ